jgi:KDO2-lipid IV(A) lauroyltransferase
MRERLASAAYATGWATVRVAPEWLPRRGFRVLADASYHRNGKWVRRLAANLRRVLGPDATEDELSDITHAAVRSYLRYWMEVFRLPVLSHDDVVDGMQMADQARLQAAYADPGRGVILALPHMGNWDAAGAWCVHLDMPFTTVAERLRPTSLFDRFVEFRRGLGMEVLPLTGDAGPFRMLRQRLQEGGMLCLLADRDLTSSGVPVSFFGSSARMPAGPAVLAMETGAALLPVTLWYPEDGGPGWRGRIHEELVPPTTGTHREKVTALTQQLADVFATAIAAHPADWHMVQRLWVSDLDPLEDSRRTTSAEPGAVA